jgi:hypothetical protein
MFNLDLLASDVWHLKDRLVPSFGRNNVNLENEDSPKREGNIYARP